MSTLPPPASRGAAGLNAGETAFGSLLKGWRERRGVSQMGLGLQAEVSARHISFLETGRARPSSGMVLRLAVALDLPLRDRNDLLLGAGFAPRYGERSLGDAEVEEVMRVTEATI